MKLIDPVEFRDLFPSVHSVAVVGNAPCILESKNGAVIDSHDMVVRFNRARTEGLEEAIGSRTDVLFVNAANSLAKAPPPQSLSRPRCLVCFVSPQGVKTLDLGAFREWAGDLPVLFSFGPDLIGLPSPLRVKPLTSGTYALFTLLRLFDVNRLFVTGFTMFGAVPGGAGKYWNEPIPAAPTVHDLDVEAGMFIALLQDFQGELTITEEVRSLARKYGVSLGPDAAPNGKLHGTKQGGIRQRLADGLSWRLIKAGMALRRISESS